MRASPARKANSFLSRDSSTDQANGTRLVALVREVGEAIAEGERTHIERLPVDVDRAREQHRTYVEALEAAGCEVVWLPDLPDAPDGVFVEDTAVVVDEVAIAARPGVESRRGEVASVIAALRRDREVAEIEAPGTLDGGDVVVVEKRVFVGRTERTNEAGVGQLAAILEPHGYDVRSLDVWECLHLKSAATPIGDDTLLVHRHRLDLDALDGVRLVDVDPREPDAANALLVGDTVLLSAAFPRTAEHLTRNGFHVQLVEADELARAEGGLTCSSIVYRRHHGGI